MIVVVWCEVVEVCDCRCYFLWKSLQQLISGAWERCACGLFVVVVGKHQLVVVVAFVVQGV